MVKLVNILLMLLIFLSASFIHAQEIVNSLYYAKLGSAYPPGDSSNILPSFGLGARFQRGHYGWDLSLNLASAVFINYASLKGMFLFYPQTETKYPLYLGFGSGIGYHLSSVPMGQPFGSRSSEYGNVTLEGILGYEFRHASHFKTFIQLELSQPAFGFGGHQHRYSYRPGIAFTAGFGF